MPKINFPLLLLCFLTMLCCHVKPTSSSSSCTPSSCGKVNRIGFPFRLKGDPATCGDRKFELECRNNQLLVNIKSNVFHVESIDYNNYTMRVLDPALDKTNPCSFSFSFTREVSYSDYIYNSEYGKFSSLNVPIAFINCRNPVKSSSYVDISSCGNSSGGLHSYVIEPSKLVLSDLEPSCGMDNVIPVADLGTTDFRSLPSIHAAAANGFDLSWYYGMCTMCSGGCTIEDEALVCHRDDSCDDHNPYGELTFRCQFQIYWLIYILYFITFPLVAIVGLRLLIGIPAIIVLIKYQNKRRHPFSDWEKAQEITQKGQTDQFKPIHYTYHEIKKMTNNFKQKLAEGSHGSLYRGKLRSGPTVAVKTLSTEKKTEEFLTFVSAIGRADHPNVMQLIGFCCERDKRALVYDLMPNGSLQKHISPDNSESVNSLSCETQFKISLGVARGISYLHENSDVTHLGFRPHNVLLDENLAPKISDFGAKSARAAAAPEYYYKGGGEVGRKSDVYGFGMMLVGMICRLENVSSSSAIYEGNIEEVEIRGASEEEKKMVKKMMRVASSCIRMRAGDRPSMDEVVRELEEENGDLQIIC